MLTLGTPGTAAMLAAGATVDPHPGMILPFGLLLLAIALGPFVNRSWWERRFHLVAVGLSLVTTLYYVLGLGRPERMLATAHEYVSFIALIGSLFVVSGGIHIRVKGESTPAVNCLYLGFGAILANVIGTTGASMLMIRPWIRANRYRITAFHVVFFIFVVSNVAGSLTPVGDPPLFLGYLKGVPFHWTLAHCGPAWAVAVGSILAVFYWLDRRNFLRAPKAVRDRETGEEQWRLDGALNLVFLAAVLGAVFVRTVPGLSEAIMVTAAVGSCMTTPATVHEANDFSFGPIKEVAWLFAGIFATMVPALDYLELHAAELRLSSPMTLYFASGSLSSVLDNAPTYLAFLAAAMGNHRLSLNAAAEVAEFVQKAPRELLAISLGAVFFGAMTYIGNGPNFMVKAIADQAKVHTPSFFGYLFRFSLPVLLPIFILVALLFF